MQQAFDEMQTWTSDNSMKLLHPKTNEMLTSFATTTITQIPLPHISGETFWCDNVRWLDIK